MGIRKLYNLYNVYFINEFFILFYYVFCICYVLEIVIIFEVGIYVVFICMLIGKGLVVDLVGRY